MNAEEDNIKKLIILKCTSCEEMTWERTNNYRESHRIYLFIPSTKTKPPKNEPTKRDKSSPQPCLGRPRPRQDRLRFVDEPARGQQRPTSSRKSACETWNPMPVMEDSFFCFAIFLSALCPLFYFSPSQLYLDKKKKAQAVGKSNIKRMKNSFSCA